MTLLAPAALAAEPPQPARPAAAAVPTADELDAYLTRHVLAPRFPACVDREHGGFHANFATDWTRQPDRHRFIVYQARNTWNAATIALARPASRDEYLGYTRHGVAFLRDRMWDREHGGFFDAVALDGTPETAGGGTKMTYGQAFAVYALALAHRATGDSGSLELARRAYEWVETHCRQRGGPGYLSGVQRDGSPIRVDEDAVTPGREVASMGVPALYLDMNTSIHVLEAWTELLKEWPDPGLRARTRGLFELLRDSFYSEPGTLHLYLDRAGRPIAGPSSFGHDVETGFLLLEAAEALGVPGDPRTQRVARRLVDHALALGWNGETRAALRGRLRPAAGLRPLRAVVGPVRAGERALADGRAARAARRRATARRWRRPGPSRASVSPTSGTAVSSAACDEHGRVVPTKSNDWFAGYHTTRALLLTSDRLRGPAR